MKLAPCHLKRVGLWIRSFGWQDGLGKVGTSLSLGEAGQGDKFPRVERLNVKEVLKWMSNETKLLTSLFWLQLAPYLINSLIRMKKVMIIISNHVLFTINCHSTFNHANSIPWDSLSCLLLTIYSCPFTSVSFLYCHLTA